jgi:hypothetical protein
MEFRMLHYLSQINSEEIPETANDWGVSCGPQARQLHARVRRLSAMGASPVATQFNVTMSVSGYA